MKSTEENLDLSSEYFNYVPSVQGKNVFFYPISTGHFLYKPGYCLERNSYDSYLLMYVLSGEALIETEEFSGTAHEKDFVLIDCYKYHKYATNAGYDCLWMHFDGVLAHRYYQMIHERLGNIFYIHGSRSVADKLQEIIQIFSQAKHISEPYISRLITDILTDFLIYENHNKTSKRYRLEVSMEHIVSYINEHFREDLTIEQLSSLAGLSPYHFIRAFKQGTGYTPHEYLINTRIENAKYLLTTTGMSAKDICFDTGFSGESVFCSSFRKKTGMTPSDYRNRASG